MANEAIPLYDRAEYLPCKASAPVTGRRFVGVSGDLVDGVTPQVAHAAAGSKPLGVAQFDSRVEDDHHVTVAHAPGLIIPVESSGAIDAGDEVEVGAAGVAVVFAAGIKAGLAVSTAAAGQVFVSLY